MQATFKLTAALAVLMAQPAMAFDSDISPFKKWGRVIQEEKVSVVPREVTIKTLQEEIDRYSGFAYRSDLENYGADDYWATREEFQAKKSGDCEDYAIAWYFDLLEAGVPDDDMRLWVVLKKDTQELHAVLSVLIDGKLAVLDSQYPVVMSGRHMQNFVIAYGINRNGWER